MGGAANAVGNVVGGAANAVGNVVNPISSVAGKLPVVGPIAGPVAGYITGGPMGAASSVAGQALTGGYGGGGGNSPSIGSSGLPQYEPRYQQPFQPRGLSDLNLQPNIPNINQPKTYQDYLKSTWSNGVGPSIVPLTESQWNQQHQDLLSGKLYQQPEIGRAHV